MVSLKPFQGTIISGTSPRCMFHHSKFLSRAEFPAEPNAHIFMTCNTLSGNSLNSETWISTIHVTQLKVDSSTKYNFRTTVTAGVYKSLGICTKSSGKTPRLYFGQITSGDSPQLGIFISSHFNKILIV